MDCKYPIDLTKPVQTRDGRQVTILDAEFRNLDAERRIIYKVPLTPGGRRCGLYSANKFGHCDIGESSCDLVNILTKKSYWVNIYRDADGYLYSEIRNQSFYAGGTLIKQISIEIEEV